MFKIIVLTLAFLIFDSEVKAQNLVPNPSFEDTINCPVFLSQIDYARYWDNCGKGSSDFFYNCAASGTAAGVPTNWIGYQHASTGNGYAGFICYTGGSGDEREYIFAKLISKLIVGQKYFLQFRVSKADDSTLFSGSASNKLGARFRTTACMPVQSATAQVSTYPDNFAHIYSNTIVTDKLNWTTLSGSFVADSAYEYIVLGNFYKDAQTNAIHAGAPTVNGRYVSYYYIDDICVSSNSTTCISTTAMHENMTQNLLHIYPNPTGGNVKISASENIVLITIVNIQGSQIKEITGINALEYDLDMFSLENGVYFLTLTTMGERISKLIIKN